MLNHLLLQTPRANLSAAVGWFQTTYSVRFNRRLRRSGQEAAKEDCDLAHRLQQLADRVSSVRS
jgi:hypothetical protein